MSADCLVVPFQVCSVGGLPFYSRGQVNPSTKYSLKVILAWPAHAYTDAYAAACMQAMHFERTPAYTQQMHARRGRQLHNFPKIKVCPCPEETTSAHAHFLFQTFAFTQK